MLWRLLYKMGRNRRKSEEKWMMMMMMMIMMLLLLLLLMMMALVQHRTDPRPRDEPTIDPLYLSSVVLRYASWIRSGKGYPLPQTLHLKNAPYFFVRKVQSAKTCLSGEK